MSRCREAFGRIVRLTGALERSAIGRLLILVHAFDAMDLQRATASRFLSWFRRICRGCDLLFWRWEKHDCAACLKRREWREELQRRLVSRWDAARRPAMRDTTDGFVWAVACRCGCHSVELTEDGAMCAQCGLPGPAGIAWPARCHTAD